MLAGRGEARLLQDFVVGRDHVALTLLARRGNTAENLNLSVVTDAELDGHRLQHGGDMCDRVVLSDLSLELAAIEQGDDDLLDPDG